MGNQLEPSEKFASNLAERLRGRGAESTWNEFLQRYARVIMLIARRHHPDREEASDCFVFICEKLCENEFDRLTRFRPEGRASFKSWLNVIVANLCIDWHRSRYGRIRPFRCVQALSPLDQAVFRYRFLQQRSLNACLELLRPRFPEINQPLLASSVQRLNTTLTPRQHWQLSVMRQRFESFDEQNSHIETASGSANFPARPDEQGWRSQRREKIARAMDRLDTRERLVLRLRYQQDLSLKEICRLMRLDHPAQAHRLISKALSHLKQNLGRDITSR